MNHRPVLGPIVRRLRGEQGQVLPMMALILAILIGIAGYVVDIGRVYIAQRQLQNAVDAAALVAGQNMPNGLNAYTASVSYGGTGKNLLTGYGVTADAPLVTFKCLQTMVNNHVPCATDTSAGPPCNPKGSQPPVNATGDPSNDGKCNAVSVTETATVTTTFAHLFWPSFTVTATASAAMRGGIPHPLDIAVVLDTTGSMSSDSCGDAVRDPTSGAVVIAANATRDIDCAKNGVRTLLSGLLPCNPSYQSCAGEPPLDEVTLLAFPQRANPTAFLHDTTFPVGVHNDLNLEFGCPGSLSTAPTWYQSSNGNQNDEVERATRPNSNPTTFTLTFGGAGAGHTTGTLRWTTQGVNQASTAAQVQAALQGLTTIGTGNVKVTGSTGGPFTITFVGLLGNTNLGTVAANTLTGSGATITTPTQGAAYDPGFPGWYFDSYNYPAGASDDVSYAATNGTYTIAGLSNDFKASATSDLSPTSHIVDAVSWDTCPGFVPGTSTTGSAAGYPGNQYYGANTYQRGRTYFADAITAAQNAIANDVATRRAQGVIILLSDGTANVDVHGANPCTDAVNASRAAAQAGTWVYSILYGVSNYNTSCGDSTYTAVSAMQHIARNETDTTVTQFDPTKFFCDPVPTQNVPPGFSCNTAGTLNAIFQSIGTSLTASRLIPDNTP